MSIPQVLGINIDQAATSRIEKGYQPVCDYALVELAKALKARFTQIFTRSDPGVEALSVFICSPYI